MYIVVLKQDLWCPQLKLEPTVTASFSTSGVILSILEGIAAFPFPVVFITFLKFFVKPKHILQNNNMAASLCNSHTADG